MRPNGRPPGSRDRHGRCVRAVPAVEAERLIATLGGRIRALREEQDVSASELAAALGCHVQTVHRWECGRGRVTLSACLRVAAALGVQVADVLDG